MLHDSATVNVAEVLNENEFSFFEKIQEYFVTSIVIKFYKCLLNLEGLHAKDYGRNNRALVKYSLKRFCDRVKRLS